MTPDQLATLHRAAFTLERPWSAAEFKVLLDNPHCRLIAVDRGFALARTIVDETELLTLAVDPAHRRLGLGHQLVTDWLAQTKAQVAFLEVAADNRAARSLYESVGFSPTHTRRSYYARESAPNVDALLLRKVLTPDQHGD